MTPEWLTPDPDEDLLPNRHGWFPALPKPERRLVAQRARHAQWPIGQRKALWERVGLEFGISPRTVQRYAAERFPCPCPCCLTSVRGGGLCSWCRKSGHR